MDTLNEYQIEARKTAVYPEQYRVTYPTLGLIGEIGEFVEAIHNGSNRETLIKEAGDVCWYFANLCYDLHITLDSIHNYSDAPKLSRFNVESIAESVKKLLRDGHSIEQLKKVKLSLARNFEYFLFLTEELRLGLKEILDTNIIKLTSRKERGVLGGSGDNR